MSPPAKPPLTRIATGIALPTLGLTVSQDAAAQDSRWGAQVGINNVTNADVPGFLEKDGYSYALNGSGLNWTIGGVLAKDLGDTGIGGSEKHTLIELSYRRFGTRLSFGFAEASVKEGRLVGALLFQRRFHLSGLAIQPTLAWGPQAGFRLSPTVKTKVEASFGGYSYSYSGELDLRDYDFRKWWMPDLGVTGAAGVIVPLGDQEVDVSLRLTQGLVPQNVGYGEGMIRQIGLFGGIYF